MKRIVTVFFFTAIMVGLGVGASAQVGQHQTRPIMVPPGSTHEATPNLHASQAGLSSTPATNGSETPLALTITDSVSYFQDTTNDNWWIYAPVFSAGADSLNNFNYGSKLYVVISDSIGDIQIGLGPGVDTTAFDTTYYRVMALRVSTPTNLKANTARLDSAAITLFPIAMSPNDSIVFHVVPMEDVQFTRNGSPIGSYPIPDLFASTANGLFIAKGSIKASALTMGSLNTVTVNFGHKTLGTRKHFGILAYVDGPDFVNDTIGFQLDANLSAATSVEIDTDGSLGSVAGVSGPVEMRTYKGNLDGGHMILGGGTKPSQVGGISNFFIGWPQFDPATGQSTGQSFFGNLVMTSYISGTSSAGVTSSDLSHFSLGESYPNPVSSEAQISYNLGVTCPVSLKLYNTLGEEVATMVNHTQGSGEQSVTFDASNIPDGLYYYKLQAGDFVATRMMVVSK